MGFWSTSGRQQRTLRIFGSRVIGLHLNLREVSIDWSFIQTPEDDASLGQDWVGQGANPRPVYSSPPRLGGSLLHSVGQSTRFLTCITLVLYCTAAILPYQLHQASLVCIFSEAVTIRSCLCLLSHTGFKDQEVENSLDARMNCEGPCFGGTREA